MWKLRHIVFICIWQYIAIRIGSIDDHCQSSKRSTYVASFSSGAHLVKQSRRKKTIFDYTYYIPNVYCGYVTCLFLSERAFAFSSDILTVSHHHEVLRPPLLLVAGASMWVQLGPLLDKLFSVCPTSLHKYSYHSHHYYNNRLYCKKTYRIMIVLFLGAGFLPLLLQVLFLCLLLVSYEVFQYSSALGSLLWKVLVEENLKCFVSSELWI